MVGLQVINVNVRWNRGEQCKKTFSTNAIYISTKREAAALHVISFTCKTHDRAVGLPWKTKWLLSCVQFFIDEVADLSPFRLGY